MDILKPYSTPIYVNSANRTSGLPANFTIDLTDQIPVPNNYDSIVVTDAAIPKSYYVVTSFNNTLILTENTTSTLVSIPIGNYDFTTLAVQLGSSLTAASTIAATYTVTPVILTGRYTFYTNKTNTTSLSFQGKPFGYNLGFLEETYSFTAQTLVAPYNVNLQFTSTLYLYCSEVKGKNKILAQIVPNQANYGVISFQETCPAYKAKPLQESSSTSMSFYLQDEFGNQLDLNGVDMQFTMCMYKLDDSSRRNMLDKRLDLVEKDIDNLITTDKELEQEIEQLLIKLLGKNPR